MHGRRGFGASSSRRGENGGHRGSHSNTERSGAEFALATHARFTAITRLRDLYERGTPLFHMDEMARLQEFLSPAGRRGRPFIEISDYFDTRHRVSADEHGSVPSLS